MSLIPCPVCSESFPAPPPRRAVRYAGKQRLLPAEDVRRLKAKRKR